MLRTGIVSSAKVREPDVSKRNLQGTLGTNFAKVGWKASRSVSWSTSARMRKTLVRFCSKCLES